MKPGGNSDGSQARRKSSHVPGLSFRLLMAQSIRSPRVGSAEATLDAGAGQGLDSPAPARRPAPVPGVRERRAAAGGRGLRGARARARLLQAPGEGGEAGLLALVRHVPALFGTYRKND